MAPEDRAGTGGEELRRALEMAGSLLGKNGPDSGDQPSEAGTPDLGKLLEAMMDQKQADDRTVGSDPPPEQSGDPKLAAVLAALPQIMDAMSGNADLVKAEKVNLVRAIKPYLPGEHASSIDRAIRLANVTKAAKNALRLLGR